MGQPLERRERTVDDGQRLDRWLWFSRLVKSRTSAAQLVADGKVRVNRVRISKPSHAIHPGDVLTLALRGNIRVVRVVECGHRRGPPLEAKMLYETMGSDPKP
jgi:ribosome-associated heat shock protein Hsp15